jgi:hypothetical protein
MTSMTSVMMKTKKEECSWKKARSVPMHDRVDLSKDDTEKTVLKR